MYRLGILLSLNCDQMNYLTSGFTPHYCLDEIAIKFGYTIIKAGANLIFFHANRGFIAS